MQDEIRADIRRRARHPDRGTSGSPLLADADTCVAPVLDIAEVAADPQFAARGAIVEARPPGAAAPFRQLAPLLAGARRRDAYDLPDPTVTDTDDAAGRGRHARRRDRGAARPKG